MSEEIRGGSEGARTIGATDELPGETSRYGVLFWVALVLGWALVAFGLRSLVRFSGATKPADLAFLFFVLLLGHDLVVVPICCAVGLWAGRQAPPRGRATLTAALAMTGIVALLSFPVLAGFGRLPDNPSFLPRDYWFGFALLLVLVWGTSAFLLVRAMRPVRPDRASGGDPEPGAPRGPG